MIAPESFRWLSTKNAAINPITELTNIIGLTNTSEARIPMIPPNNPKMNSSDLLANYFHQLLSPQLEPTYQLKFEICFLPPD
jgi:hypothetical protein